MELRVLKGGSEFASTLIEQILALDRANMQKILADSGLRFPKENRRAGFKRNPTLILAEKNGKIVGYLEFTRSWSDPDIIYLSSIKIARKYRHSKLILQLIDKFIETIRRENFTGFETNVQKNNLTAVKLYQKIGFRFKENPRNPASWQLEADRRILIESPVNLLLEKWRKKVRDLS